MEKPNLNKYEIMCFFKEDEKQKKEEWIMRNKKKGKEMEKPMRDEREKW